MVTLYALQGFVLEKKLNPFVKGSELVFAFSAGLCRSDAPVPAGWFSKWLFWAPFKDTKSAN